MALLLVSAALAYIVTVYFLTNPIGHTRRFMWRRFVNWFPLGMTYSFLYMGRYNMSVAAVALGALMDKRTFGVVTGSGLTTYALGLLFVGPLVDRLGGKRGMLIGAIGSSVFNFAMAVAVYMKLNGTLDISMGTALAVLYSLNMLCQSFGAVSTIKVKSYWFHVRERGTFGAIFGTLISMGVYFAFDWGRAIANAVQLEQPAEPTFARTVLNNLFALDGRTVPALWLIFAIPAAIMLVWALIDVILLKDTPDQAGFDPLDTHDASSDEMAGDPTRKDGYFQLIWRVLSNPIILMIGVVELTSGVLRDGILNWYLLFSKETGMGLETVTVNWGFWGAVTGIAGGFAAGWISDRFFNSRRAPSAALMQAIMFATTGLMLLSLTLVPAKATLESSGAAPGSFAAWLIGARPMIIGACAVTTMMAVIGVHSIMSGTATADFGGKRAAGTATGIADAFSKLGAAIQSFVIGYLATSDWSYWPMVLFPFTIVGLVFSVRMWTLLPSATRRYLAEVESRKLAERQAKRGI
jgi:OPA family glycerol-3-phosphate transporter-like MFS transporter